MQHGCVEDIELFKTTEGEREVIIHVEQKLYNILKQIKSLLSCVHE